MVVSKKTFSSGWELLLDNFSKSRKDGTLAGLHLALVNYAPQLTDEQFIYAVQMCLLRHKYMPSLNELLMEVYEMSSDGMPGLPDIDPRYANEFQMAAYNKALNIQNEWKVKNNSRPDVGVYRKDRIDQIPGVAEHLKALKGLADREDQRHNDWVLRKRIADQRQGGVS